MNGFLFSQVSGALGRIAGRRQVPSLPSPTNYRQAALAILLGWILSGIVPGTDGATLPVGFVETEVGGYWDEAAGLTFDDANAMYVWDRQGRVWIVQNDVKIAAPLIDIGEEVGAWNDHGLLGFALHPNFRQNGYIYLLYAVDHHHLSKFGTPDYSPTQNEYQRATIGRLTRYTARASDDFRSVDPASRLVLIGQTATNGIPITYLTHGVGSLLFAMDGTLLVSCGDGAALSDDGDDPESYYAQALSEGILRPKENVGAFRSQLIDSLNGKILRIDPDTGAGIPGNPFYDPVEPRSPRSQVWALGLRNPFRMTLRPGTGSHLRAEGNPGVIYVGDVGYFAWEEHSVVTGAGMNFGWPVFEGFSPPSSYDGTDPANLDAPNPLFGIGGCPRQHFTFRDLLKEATLGAPSWPNPCDIAQEVPESIPRFVHSRPAIDWMHGSGPSRVGIFSGNNAAVVNEGAPGSPVSGPQFGGNCSIGGIFYQGDDFPPDFKNTYFHGDLGNQWIKNFIVDTNDNLLGVRDFASGLGGLVFIGTHPTNGALYYIDFFGWLRRVNFVGSGNRPPVAVATANLTYGPGPLTVQFSGGGSSDPDGDPLNHDWNFGDGSADSAAVNPIHTFNAPGGIPTRHDVTLTVTDTSAATNAAKLIISVNNTPPNVAVTSPAPGTMYSMTGQTIYNLAATVTDTEHAPAQLNAQWQTALHHNNHIHPEPVDTNWNPTVVISPLGCDGDDYFYRFTLNVTDAAGLTGSAFVDVYPNCTSNSAPALSDINDFTINEDGSTGPIAFTIADAETATGSLSLAAASSNPSLVPTNRIVFGGGGANRTVTISPIADGSGIALIEVSVSDGALTTSDTFFVTISGVNDFPTISDLADQIIAENTTTGPLSFTVGDIETAADSLLVTGVSSNPALVPGTNIVFGGSGSNRTVTVTPAAGQSGSATITVTVNDGTATVGDSFLAVVQVLAVDVLVRGEAGNHGDLLTASILSNATLGVAYGSWSLWKNGQQAAPTDFRISTAQEISLPGLSIPGGAGAGDGGTRSFAFNALRDYEYARFTLGTRRDRVAAGFALKLDTNWIGASYGSYDVFSLHSLNGEFLIVNFQDDPGATFSIQVHTSAGLGSIIPVSKNTWYWITVLWDRTNTLATLKIYDASTWGLVGTSTLFLENAQCERLQFGRSDEHGVFRDAFFYYDDIAIDLSGSKFPLVPSLDVIGNFPPVISDIQDLTINQGAATGPIGFVVGDVETPVGSLTVSASSSNPALVPANNIVFGGNGSNRTVTLTPLPGQSGSATITVTVNDGAFNATDSFVLGVVAPANTPPAISAIADLAINEDIGTGPIAFTVGDGETSATSLTLLRASTNPALVPTNNIVFGGAGASRTVTVTPATNQFGGATITVTVSDGILNATETFLVTINPVNDNPTISSLASQTIAQNTATGPLNFTIGDVESAAAMLAVTGNSSDPALVPDSNIVFGGSGSNRTITVTPLAGQTGTATISLSVNDGAAAATTAFLLTVSAVLPPTYLLAEGFEGTGYENSSWTESGSPNEDYTTTVLSGTQSLNCGNSQTIRRTVNFGDSIFAYYQIRWVTYSQYVTLVSWLNASGSMMAEFYCNSAGAPATMCHGGVCANGTTPLVAGTTFHMWMEWTRATNSNGTLKLYVSTTGIKPATPEVNIANGAGGTITQIKFGPQGSGNVIFDRLLFDDVPVGSNPGSPPNQPPTISNIADQSVSQNSATTAIPFTIGDAETAVSSLTLARASSNPTLVPTNSIVFGGSGSNRTVTVTPATGQSGTSTITVTVGDGLSTAFDTFVLTVIPPNTAPTISDITDRAINEDTGTGTIAFTIGDAQTNAASLVLTGASSNTTLVPTNSIVFGGSGSNRTVTVTPTGDQFGSATITVTVSDGALNISDSFVLTVAAVNDAPTISGFGDVNLDEDASTGPMAFLVGDVETAPAGLVVSATSSNPVLVPTNGIAFGGGGADRTVTVTPAPNRSGSAIVTVMVNDGVSPASNSFALTVHAVNDAPTIAGISDRSIVQDTLTGPILFAVDDVDNAAVDLTITGSSSDPALVPDNYIVFGGGGSNRTVEVTPFPGQIGTAVITITVNDGTAFAVETFVLIVTATNAPPAISDIADLTIDEDTSTGPIAFTIGDPETAAENLAIALDSSNPGLVPTNGFVLGGGGANRTVTLVPTVNQSGTATVRVTVGDGESSASDTFVVTVNAVNDAPTISSIADQSIMQDTAAGVISISVSDVETGADDLNLSGGSSNPSLVPEEGIIFGGSGSSRTVVVTPAVGQAGVATITITVSDGAASASVSFILTVTRNTAPAISDLPDLVIDEDTISDAIAFTVGDAETPAGSLTLSPGSSNPALVPTNNIVFGGSGANPTITVIPAADQAGDTVISVTVSDGVLTLTDSFVLTVNAVNDLPTISNLPDQEIIQDTSVSSLALTVGDVDTEADTLVLFGSSSNPSLVPDTNIVFGGSGSNRLVSVTPVAGQVGTTIIAVTVNDGAGSASDALILTVTPTNAAPIVSDFADLVIDEDTGTGPIPFTIGDAETLADSLILNRDSSNPGLVPVANITLGGNGASRVLTMTPATNQSGSTTITVSVSDGLLTASETFVLTVDAINDVPTISNIADQTTSQGTPTAAIPFNVGDVETPGASLLLSRASSNQSLVPTNNIAFGGSGANRTVTVTPAAGQSGTATITVSVSDGVASASDTFDLTVTAGGNTAPTISDITDRSISEDSNTGIISFTIGDAQTASGSLTLGKSSSNPALVPNNNIVFAGSSANRTVRVTPLANQFGTAVITVTVSDGSLSASDTFFLTVTAVNDRPTISNTTNQTTLEDISAGPIPFTIADVDTPAGSLVLTAASSNPTRVPLSNIVFGGDGTNRTVTVKPGTNQTGSATITITVSDGALTASDPFSLSIVAVNDVPTISDIADRSVAPGVSTGTIAFIIGDVETGPSSLSLSKASSNTTLVPVNNIVFGGIGANRTVRVTPAAGQFGTATITVTVSDGTASASDTFVLTVQ